MVSRTGGGALHFIVAVIAVVQSIEFVDGQLRPAEPSCPVVSLDIEELKEACRLTRTLCTTCFDEIKSQIERELTTAIIADPAILDMSSDEQQACLLPFVAEVLSEVPNVFFLPNCPGFSNGIMTIDASSLSDDQAEMAGGAPLPDPTASGVDSDTAGAGDANEGSNTAAVNEPRAALHDPQRHQQWVDSATSGGASASDLSASAEGLGAAGRENDITAQPTEPPSGHDVDADDYVDGPRSDEDDDESYIVTDGMFSALARARFVDDSSSADGTADHTHKTNPGDLRDEAASGVQATVAAYAGINDEESQSSTDGGSADDPTARDTVFAADEVYGEPSGEDVFADIFEDGAENSSDLGDAETLGSSGENDADNNKLEDSQESGASGRAGGQSVFSLFAATLVVVYTFLVPISGPQCLVERHARPAY